MRNSLFHVLFLVVPLFVAELGADSTARAARLATRPAAACATVPCPAPSAEKAAPAPTPRGATRTTRRPLPAHLFM
jgi:hypothetical protein